MSKKQGNLKIVFLVFIVLELIFVILSSSFKYKLEIGLEQGQFKIRNVKSNYNLQDKITEDFQRDDFLLKNTKLKEYEIADFHKFSSYLTGSNPVTHKAYSMLNSDLQGFIKDNNAEWNEDKKSEFINEFNKLVISNSDFYEPAFKNYLKQRTSEEIHLYNIANNKDKELSNLDNSRLNRLLIENTVPENVLKRQAGLPKIYGSFEIYNFFRNVFGEAAAMSAFYLIRMLLIVDLIFILLIILVRKSMGRKPSKGQLIMEMVYKTFDDFVIDTLGKERAHFTPYIVTIFLFIWLCNMIGLIPIPGFMEPTRNINVPLGMGIIVIIVVHFTAIKVKGVWGHLQNYLNPIKNPMAALDIVSEVSKVVSISFRLFGNILGGAIIIVVVSSLVQYIVLPVGLNLFFGVFVGTVQAFVFTMLALTYIGVEISE